MFKEMKTKLLGLAILLLVTGRAVAQDFKLNKSSGILEIRELNNVSIEGHSGNEIIFSSQSSNRDRDERAKGLRAISNMGLEDNTGLGLSVVDKGSTIEVRQLKKMDGPDVKIQVPKNVKVAFYHTSPHGHDIEIKDFGGEVEVSSVHTGVVLSNATGPINIKTVHGDIDAVFPTEPKSPISIESVHAHVDVTLPADTKANIKLSTHMGEILVDPSFKIEIEKTGDMVRYSDKVSGKINGGGIAIELSATHDNIYLRKK
jgi:predicted membrane protein